MKGTYTNVRMVYTSEKTNARFYAHLQKFVIQKKKTTFPENVGAPARVANQQNFCQFVGTYDGLIIEKIISFSNT